MIETVKEHCKHPDCKYRKLSGVEETCDYILIMRRPRGCSISECDKYESGKIKKKSKMGGIFYDDI